MQPFGKATVAHTAKERETERKRLWRLIIAKDVYEMGSDCDAGSAAT